jgi:hypothetical protein
MSKRSLEHKQMLTYFYLTMNEGLLAIPDNCEKLNKPKDSTNKRLRITQRRNELR